MSKRLNNVMSTLNIGLDTVYDFLRGKPELGTVNNLTPNSKITDEQYDALKKEYQRFGNIKEIASSVFSKIRERRHDPKPKREEKAASLISVSENVGLEDFKSKTQLPNIEKEKIKKKKNGKIKNEKKTTSNPKDETPKVELKKEKKESKKLNTKKGISMKVEKPEKNTENVKLSMSLSGFRFNRNLAIIPYKRRFLSCKINKNDKKILLSLNKTQIIPIVKTTKRDFKFGIRISELLEKVDSKIRPANSQQKQKAWLGIENIEFQENYYLVWIIRQGKIDTAIIPLKVSDSNSSPCLRLIHKYFSDRFPKGIEILYDNKRVIGLTQAYSLSHYIKVLNAKIYEYGEWWEEVQNDRKMPLATCKKIPLAEIHRNMSLRNCYIDYLAGMPCQKTALKVYEVRQNIEEDVFMFTISIQNGCCAIIFENVSFTATATWVFIVKTEYYEECVNRIFDYFTNYELHNKRLSLTKSINPPQKFKAEEYYKIMHDEPKGWIKRLNDILIRKIPLSRIRFNQGLHISKETGTRNSSPEKTKVQHLHNELMRKLYYHLCLQYGVANVGTENHIGNKKIDVVVKTEDGYNIYEIKTDKEPRNCIREAMGQILDYAFFECKDIIHKMVIVGVATESKEVNTYLTKFREKNSLEIYYMSI